MDQLAGGADAGEDHDAAVPASNEEPSRKAAETAVHPSELLGRSDVPLAPMGLPRAESVFSGNVEYQESVLHDDERDSVYRGRRLVEPIDGELANAFDSPEELAQAYLEAIFFSEPARFHALRLTREEFERYCWPEFPQSRPFTNIVAHDAWTFHEANCMDGINEARHRWPDGTELHLVDIRYETGIQQFRNFNLYKGVVIEAIDDRGNAVELDVAPVFVERNGQWKVYIYKG
jgi:hypothetical protein